MPTLALSSGHQMPVMGFGTAGIQDPNSIISAVKVGYRHFDTAKKYENEEFIGQALKDCMNQKLVTRDELFITTKLWHDNYDNVEAAMRLSLKKLQVD